MRALTDDLRRAMHDAGMRRTVFALVVFVAASLSAATLKVHSPQPTKWTGEPISIHLKDADIKDVLHMFSKLSGMNIAVDPDVHGTVTLELHDVPWDQALDLILRQNKLVALDAHGILRVKPR